MKTIRLCILASCIYLGESHALAHGVLGREAKHSGDHQVVMEMTADVPDPYAGFAITYAFLLLNKDRSQYTGFDSARVMLAEKKGGLIVNVSLSALAGGVPGTEVEASMPRAGDYVAEVSFVKQGKEIAKAAFDFPIINVPGTGRESSSPTPAPASPAREAIPGYIWALVLFAAGIALGKFGGRIYEWAF